MKITEQHQEAFEVTALAMECRGRIAEAAAIRKFADFHRRRQSPIPDDILADRLKRIGEICDHYLNRNMRRAKDLEDAMRAIRMIVRDEKAIGRAKRELLVPMILDS